MDAVEGLAVANIEAWTVVYTGTGLTTTVASGLTATKAYRFRVRAVSEHDIESPYSPIATYYAAPLPPTITYNTAGDAHLQTNKVSIWLDWQTPTLTGAELPIDSYVLYWDEGHLSSGNFTKLVQIDAYDQSHYNVTGGLLTTGHTYRFQVSAINKVGEGALSTEVTARAASLPGTPGAPERTGSAKVDGTTASVTVRWYQQDVSDTGGVPLTGYKLYYFKQTTDPPVTVNLAAATVAWDGTGQPEVTAHTVPGLDLDSDYSFVVTALNPDEGP